MMYPMLTTDRKVLVPKRAVSADGRTVGDTWVELSPQDLDYAQWLEAIERLAKREGEKR